MGVGSELRQPLGVAVVGGLIVSQAGLSILHKVKEAYCSGMLSSLFALLASFVSDLFEFANELFREERVEQFLVRHLASLL